ncbi:MAG: ester cyclase [Actinomycetota bacterium]|nr:ester cyclase [Actinomycetota bacterium]
MTDEKREAFSVAVDAWNAGDGDGYLELYDLSIRHHGLAPEPLDHQANRRFYEALWAGFPGAQLTIHDMIAEGDRLAIRFDLIGEHKGEFMSLPATGRGVVLSGQTIMRFLDGRVVERWTTADLFGLLTQLGVLPAS